MVVLTNASAGGTSGRKRNAAPAEPTAPYRVTVETWMEDARGLNELRAVGDQVDLTEAQANFLLRTGQIEPVAPADPPAVPSSEPAPRRGKGPE